MFIGHLGLLPALVSEEFVDSSLNLLFLRPAISSDLQLHRSGSNEFECDLFSFSQPFHVIEQDSLELDGQMYGSATALAKAVTGSRSISGPLFLGLTKRRR